MSLRAAHRARHIDAWNNRDLAGLLASTAAGFVFDDPTDPAPVTRDGLAAYMPVWFEKAAALGALFEFRMTERVVEDRDGALTEWYWWTLLGTEVEGSAVVRTIDTGVLLEKFAYYRTPWPLHR